MGNNNVKQDNVMPKETGEIFREKLLSNQRQEGALQQIVNASQVTIIILGILLVVVLLIVLGRFVRATAQEAAAADGKSSI